MQSTAPDVTSYIQEAPAERQPSLAALRQLCLETLAGYEECMAYGMPGYTRNGTIEVGFASQKRYISLYILKEDVVKAHRDALAGLDVGKGCIKYTRPARIDFDVVRRLLIATRESPEGAC
ncbi:MAG TPA: DUF1801 domain-containing protein [Herpetosiphonaceae bacterium]